MSERERARLPRRIVFASTSPYRRELLERLGLEFEQAAPQGVDEPALMRTLEAPERIVCELAASKARSLGARFREALIIGSDQVALSPPDQEGRERVLGKPGTAERAVEQLCRLSGRVHRLLTAVAVYEPRTGRLESALDEHRLCMRALEREAIERYVRLDAPLDCAGSYRIERRGIALMQWVRGDDFTAIIGLPLTRLTALLETFGVSVI